MGASNMAAQRQTRLVHECFTALAESAQTHQAFFRKLTLIGAKMKASSPLPVCFDRVA